MGVLQPLFQPQGGDFQNLVAPLRRSSASAGTKGLGETYRVSLVSPTFRLKETPAHPQQWPPPWGPGRGSEGGVAAALIGQALYVNLADGESGGKAPLRQQGTVLGDHVVAGEHQVGGGLPLPGVA